MAALFQDIPKLVLSPSHSLSRSVVLGVHIIHGGTICMYVSNITEGAASNNFHSSVHPQHSLYLSFILF